MCAIIQITKVSIRKFGAMNGMQKCDPPHRCPCIHAAQFDDVMLLTFEMCHAKYFFEIFEGRGGLEIHHIGMGMLLSLNVAAATAWGTQLEGSVVIHLLTMYNVEKATVC